ncbi:fumarylacetoacetate hydrolase family protein [Pseudonocardia spinosispora]|uniref:fumarylacetoacetate hydrolase family protein n=1 Tax=Pseudonocardia spinosispora TaxID=103441 RepID=UPI00040A60BD|nr:fumarylacetoacetate hydrolase family protein [Pseudonocardia spinosispora]
MRLATVRTQAGTRAVRLDADTAVETGDADVGALLRRPDWRDRAAEAAGPTHSVDDLDYAPLVPNPEKILCVGANYRDHIAEMGRQPPEFPTLFAKFPPTLIGAYDDVLLPSVSDAVDWEAELALVIGKTVRHVSAEEAPEAIAGYTVLNDVSVRDYQNRTLQWLQGKMFEATTPIGPALVTPDELLGDSSPGATVNAEISTEVDGEVLQHSDTGQLVFGPYDLIAYISAIVTLNPGDVITTGTPGGVGHARKPPRYLTDGATLTTRIAGIGECRNVCRKEKL